MKTLLTAIILMASQSVFASATHFEIYKHIKEISGIDNRKHSIALQYLYIYFNECKKHSVSDIDKFLSSKAFFYLYQDTNSAYLNISKVQNALEITKTPVTCSED